jgi:glycosyltransferase involved in cell wall biosynthesis
MKIFLICGNKYGVGTFVRAREFARSFNRMGHQVVLGYLGDAPFRVACQIDNGVLEIGLPNFLNRYNLDHMASPIGSIAVNGILSEMRFDVVHGFEHFSVIHKAGLLSKKLYGSIYVTDWADWHSIANNRKFFKIPGGKAYLRWLEEKPKNMADGITAISSLLVNKSLELGKSRDSVLYLPGGAPVDRIKPMDKTSCRKELGLPIGNGIFGYVGSFLMNELIPFISAFSRIERQDMPLMVVIGKISAELMAYVKNKGLEERVLLKGFVHEDKLSSYLSACDALLLPMDNNIYNRSRWPNKIGDYMAAGRPVIASSVGEIPAVFARGDIGIMINSTEKEICQAMEKIIDNYDGIQQKFGVNGRKIAEQELSWDIHARKLESFYKYLLDKSQSPR